MSAPDAQPSGPPYAPTSAGVGGLPITQLDVPVDAVFIFLYAVCAATTMTIFQLNKRKGHKFLLSALLFGFCMARIVANIMRIVWATRPHNVRIAIAASILNSAGVLLLYIVNLIFAQRILRSTHPSLGWHKALSIGLKVLCAGVATALILVITLTVMSFYTLNNNVRLEALWIQRGALLFLLLIAFAPIPCLAISFLVPRTGDINHFGHGSLATKALILLASSFLCSWIAGFKAGALWAPPRPASDPAWYDSKACFYVFGYTFEIIIMVMFLSFRIDQRFHVPDGSSKVRTYSGQQRLGSSGTDAEKGVVASSEQDSDLA